ncbi:MarR family winged helix-turn-helix transcriptional regulator [Pseudarthrobacter sp. N5]|uniref:MarR family winged helix-turn-helix transcriptional regulator n=1 Tax=Pseudarthrobacter sp. N5 TaxID=3418416 RepID=UPI003CFA608A
MNETATRSHSGESRHEASRLMRRILVLNQKVEKQFGREFEVNSTDLEAMQRLMERGPLSPSPLAQSLGISTAAVTVVVDRLVKMGHVCRRPHPTDRRSILIVPAPQSARRAMDGLLPMIREIDALISRYDPEQQEAITGYLARTVEVLERKVSTPQPAQSEKGGE